MPIPVSLTLKAISPLRSCARRRKVAAFAQNISTALSVGYEEGISCQACFVGANLRQMLRKIDYHFQGASRRIFVPIANDPAEQFIEGHVAQLQVRIAGLHCAPGEQAGRPQKSEPLRVSLHHFEDPRQFFRRSLGMIEQRLDITAQNRQRRAQLVRYVCDKVLSHFIELLELRDVVKKNDHAGSSIAFVLQRHGANFQCPVKNDNFTPRRLSGVQGFGDDLIEGRVANGVEQRCAQ